MTDVLRKQWGLKDLLCSYAGNSEMTEHGMGDLQTVSTLAFFGIEVDMVGEAYLKNFKKSFDEKSKYGAD
jgi:beta-glucosidase